MAEQYARLLAPKDEYEVARLYETGFIERLKADLDGDFRIKLHLAPPVACQSWSGRAATQAAPRRLAAPVLRFLAGARGSRGSWLDPFRLSAERQLDRSLLADYEADLDLLLQKRPPPGIGHELTSWPAEIRGYGPVRAAAIPAARARRDKARKTLME